MAREKVKKYLQREPKFKPAKLKFIPNVLWNAFGLGIAMLVILVLLYLLAKFLIFQFYHFG